MTDAEKELDALRVRLHGLLYLAFQRGRDSVGGAAGDRMKFLEAAGSGLILTAEAAGTLHEAYAAFARVQFKAGKDTAPKGKA